MWLSDIPIMTHLVTSAVSGSILAGVQYPYQDAKTPAMRNLKFASRFFEYVVRIITTLDKVLTRLP